MLYCAISTVRYFQLLIDINSEKLQAVMIEATRVLVINVYN